MRQFYIIFKVTDGLYAYELSARSAAEAMTFISFYLLGAQLSGDILSITSKPSRGITYLELNL